MKKILAFHFAFLFLTTTNILAQKPIEMISRTGVYQGYSEKTHKGFNYLSQYIRMQDGTKIAIDVFLPNKLESGQQVPTISYFVRYVRTIKLKGVFRALAGHPYFAHVKREEIEFLTSHGYACVIVDLRGSGASFGKRTMEFSPQEVEDMSEIVDWVIAQKWSDGKLGSTGVSYTGTTAELLLANQHPAVKACINRSGIFDLYEHITYPGGIAHGPFVDVWGFTTQSLDDNNFLPFAKNAKMLVKGINPVQSDKRGDTLAMALAERDNFDVFKGLKEITFRDEVHQDLGHSISEYSIHNRIEAIEGSNTPIYRISGWFDGALMKSAFYGYMNTSNTEKVLLGPWSHGATTNLSPFHQGKEEKFDLKAEMLRFWDHYLKGIDNGIDKEPDVVYYNMGKEEYREINTWPPENTFYNDVFLCGNEKLTAYPAPGHDESVYICDTSVGTGDFAKWNSLTDLYITGPVNYPDRTEVNKKMLVFDSHVYEESVDITGHPSAELYVSSNTTDAALYVYLEDVTPGGKVTYITEGQLRALHRKIEDDPVYDIIGPAHSFNKEDGQALEPGKVVKMEFELLPISYLLKKGHQLRVSIASADVHHFDLVENAPDQITIHHGADYPSRVKIPVLK